MGVPVRDARFPLIARRFGLGDALAWVEAVLIVALCQALLAEIVVQNLWKADDGCTETG